MILTPLSGPELDLTSHTRDNEYGLRRSMVLQDEQTGLIYGIPAGFRGKESIPFIFPETAPGDAGGLPHDFMYTFGFIYVWHSPARLWVKNHVTRAFADEFYRAACVAYGGFRWWASCKKWVGLRVPGALAWHRHRRAGRVWAGPEPSVCFPGGVEPCPPGSAA